LKAANLGEQQMRVIWLFITIFTFNDTIEFLYAQREE